MDISDLLKPKKLLRFSRFGSLGCAVTAIGCFLAIVVGVAVVWLVIILVGIGLEQFPAIRDWFVNVNILEDGQNFIERNWQFLLYLFAG